MTSPRDHARNFKEMLCITKELPLGERPPPSDKLGLQWYYMTYHRNDRLEYVQSGKKLSNETIDTCRDGDGPLLEPRKTVCEIGDLRQAQSAPH
jgi:hypothetical protein